MNEPLVSIICLCYNHANFLHEALDSVFAQTYPNLEILVVDDASTDASAHIIAAYADKYPNLNFLPHAQNQGNCASFNQAFQVSKGDFIIDFATDDVLHPDRVRAQVEVFCQLPPECGVVYTNAELIDDASQPLGLFHKQTASGNLVPAPAEGDVFEEVLRRYFICPPTMMMRRAVLEELNGYDPTLAYEDFDFWVRSSRRWKYHFLNQVLCQRRLHEASLSKQAYKKGDLQLASTIQVIKKAQNLVQTSTERNALRKRIKYEARHAYFTANYPEALKLLRMLQEEQAMDAEAKVLTWLAKKKVPLQFIRRWYHGWRYRHTSA